MTRRAWTNAAAAAGVMVALAAAPAAARQAGTAADDKARQAPSSTGETITGSLNLGRRGRERSTPMASKP